MQSTSQLTQTLTKAQALTSIVDTKCAWGTPERLGLAVYAAVQSTLHSSDPCLVSAYASDPEAAAH